MPTSPGTWWHVTVAALNARTGPGTNYARRNGADGRPYVATRGHNFRVIETKRAGGRLWLHSDHGAWYAADYCRKGKATVVGARPPSPVVGRSGPTYPFGVRNSRYAAGFHTGADWAASTGTPIVAVVGGVVRQGGRGGSWGGAYGNWTVIQGTDGHQWLYAHQSSRKARLGQRVKAGQVIGYVGATGKVTGPHLHLEKSRGPRWWYGNVIRPTW